MTKRIGSGSLVIATHNSGKLKEISALLEPHGVKCLSAGSLGLPEPAETGTTFAENALIKARASAEASGMAALADDSGLSVVALDGALVFTPPIGRSDNGSKAKRAATGIWPWARSRVCWRRMGKVHREMLGSAVCLPSLGLMERAQSTRAGLTVR